MAAEEVARDDGDRALGDQHADAGFELGELAIAAAGTFGEENEDAVFLIESLAELVESVTATVVSPHRKCVQEHHGEQRLCFCFEENVTGGDWEGTNSLMPFHGGKQGECIEVAAVIGDKDE